MDENLDQQGPVNLDEKYAPPLRPQLPNAEAYLARKAYDRGIAAQEWLRCCTAYEDEVFQVEARIGANFEPWFVPRDKERRTLPDDDLRARLGQVPRAIRAAYSVASSRMWDRIYLILLLIFVVKLALYLDSRCGSDESDGADAARRQLRTILTLASIVAAVPVLSVVAFKAFYAHDLQPCIENSAFGLGVFFALASLAIPVPACYRGHRSAQGATASEGALLANALRRSTDHGDVGDGGGGIGGSNAVGSSGAQTRPAAVDSAFVSAASAAMASPAVRPNLPQLPPLPLSMPSPASPRSAGDKNGSGAAVAAIGAGTAHAPPADAPHMTHFAQHASRILEADWAAPLPPNTWRCAVCRRVNDFPISWNGRAGRAIRCIVKPRKSHATRQAMASACGDGASCAGFVAAAGAAATVGSSVFVEFKTVVVVPECTKCFTPYNYRGRRKSLIAAEPAVLMQQPAAAAAATASAAVERRASIQKPRRGSTAAAHSCDDDGAGGGAGGAGSWSNNRRDSRKVATSALQPNHLPDAIDAMAAASAQGGPAAEARASARAVAAPAAVEAEAATTNGVGADGAPAEQPESPHKDAEEAAIPTKTKSLRTAANEKAMTWQIHIRKAWSGVRQRLCAVFADGGSGDDERLYYGLTFKKDVETRFAPRLQPLPPDAAAGERYAIGETVESTAGKGVWYPATVVAARDNDTYDVRHDDGETASHVFSHQVRRRIPRRYSPLLRLLFAGALVLAAGWPLLALPAFAPTGSGGGGGGGTGGSSSAESGNSGGGEKRAAAAATAAPVAASGALWLAAVWATFGAIAAKEPRAGWRFVTRLAVAYSGPPLALLCLGALALHKIAQQQLDSPESAGGSGSSGGDSGSLGGSSSIGGSSDSGDDVGDGGGGGSPPWTVALAVPAAALSTSALPLVWAANPACGAAWAALSMPWLLFVLMLGLQLDGVSYVGWPAVATPLAAFLLGLLAAHHVLPLCWDVVGDASVAPLPRLPRRLFSCLLRRWRWGLGNGGDSRGSGRISAAGPRSSYSSGGARASTRNAANGSESSVNAGGRAIPAAQRRRVSAGSKGAVREDSAPIEKAAVAVSAAEDIPAMEAVATTPSSTTAAASTAATASAESAGIAAPAMVTASREPPARNSRPSRIAASSAEAP